MLFTAMLLLLLHPPPQHRQLYHLRHARDYEELGLPMGASKIDIKKAYK
jgi:DnaJ-class molecular chaperone